MFFFGNPKKCNLHFFAYSNPHKCKLHFFCPLPPKGVGMAHSPIALTRLLHTLQILALDFGLELNFSKCEHIALHSCERIRFCPDLNSEQCPCNLCFGSTEPSKLVTLVTSARYLGAHVNDTGSSAEHIKNRLSKATAAAKLLGAFFRNQCISPSFRLLVHQSVVQSILHHREHRPNPSRACSP